MTDINAGFTSFQQLGLLLPIISIVLSVVTLVVTLDCVWRVDKGLKRFMQLLLLVVGVGLLRKILGVLGFSQSPWWTTILLVFDLVNSLFLLLAMWEMYRIIRRVSREGQR